MGKRGAENLRPSGLRPAKEPEGKKRQQSAGLAERQSGDCKSCSGKEPTGSPATPPAEPRRIPKPGRNDINGQGRQRSSARTICWTLPPGEDPGQRTDRLVPLQLEASSSTCWGDGDGDWDGRIWAFLPLAPACDPRLFQGGPVSFPPQLNLVLASPDCFVCITLGKGWCSDDSQSACGEGLIEWRGVVERKDALLPVDFCFDSVHHFNFFPFF